MDHVSIRPAMRDDIDLLWDFLAIAAYEPDVGAAKSVPMIRTWLDGWLRPGDFGFIADRDGSAIGAIWARQFESREESWFYIDDRTPEISIGVRESARGNGVGALLLRTLMEAATSRACRLCLNVRQTNPAQRLYQRMGFRIVPEMTVRNRVGGLSLGMLWDGPP